MSLWAVLTQQEQKVYDGWDALVTILAVVERTAELDLAVPTVGEGMYWVHQVKPPA
jgi:hypothetical protein